MTSPEQRNYGEIERLQQLLESLRSNPSTARETEAIREVGAMLTNVGWEQTFATDRNVVSPADER